MAKLRSVLLAKGAKCGNCRRSRPYTAGLVACGVEPRDTEELCGKWLERKRA